MFLRFFKGTGPGVLFVIIFSLLAVWFNAFLNPLMDSVSRYETDPMPLYGLLKMAVGPNPFTGVVVSFLLVSAMTFLLVNFNTNVFFINERTFLPAMIYILCSGFFPQYQLLNPVLPASLFLLLAIIRIMESYHKPGIAYNFFDAGILISTGSLFYADLIWFAVLVIIGIILIRTGNLTEIVTSILGLMTPWFLTFGVYYVIGKDLTSLLLLVKDNLFEGSEGYVLPGFTFAALICTCIILLVSIAYLVRQMNTKKIKSRKTFSLLIFVFSISLIIFFVLPSVSFEIIWLISIPGCYFMAHYFTLSKKRLISEIFFSLFFVFVLLIQILYLK
jgi:hypothetical protein